MNQRGSALIEGLVSLGVMVSLLSATLIAAYAAMGRAYVEYRAEQALYCLAEGQAHGLCRRVLVRTIRNTLPFGRTAEIQFSSERDRWSITTAWHLGPFLFSVDKSLSRRRIRKGVTRS